MKKLIAVLVIICCVLAYFIAKEVMDVTDIKKGWNITILLESPCDLQQGPCEFEFENQKYTLKVANFPIVINKKQPITLEGNFENIQDVWVDFKGIEIDMGYNRLQLKAQQTQLAGDMYLPSCELEVMTWRAMVILKRHDKLYGFVYKFKTDKNHEN